MTQAAPIPRLDESPPTAATSDYEYALQTYRGRWLRRRFLWLCATGVMLDAGVALMDVLTLNSVKGGQLIAQSVGIGNTLAGIALSLAAFLYAWRSPPRVATILRLAVVVVAASVSITLVATRIQFGLAPGTPPANVLVTPLESWALFAPTTIGLAHFVACLFIPWTTRESLRPVWAIFAVYAACVFIDLGLHQTTPIPPLSVAMIILSPLAALPGILVCAWRDWRFQRRFRLEYESSGYRKLQGELLSARRLHEASLPPQRHSGPVQFAYAYEPAQHIGGDLLFVHPPHVAATRLSAVILDVTGHGIGSALMVNRLVGELERLFGERPDISPGQLIAALNRYVCLTMSRHDVYVTALCAQVDLAARKIRFSSGGHPPALLHRADGHIELLGSTSLMLGVLPGEAYGAREGELALFPGDTILAYTDGVLEARNDRGDFFDLAGIRQTLLDLTSQSAPPQAWPRTLLQRVIEHRDSPAADDALIATIIVPRG